MCNRESLWFEMALFYIIVGHGMYTVLILINAIVLSPM